MAAVVGRGGPRWVVVQCRIPPVAGGACAQRKGYVPDNTAGACVCRYAQYVHTFIRMYIDGGRQIHTSYDGHDTYEHGTTRRPACQAASLHSASSIG